ncbi:protein phosphatase 2C 29 [Artemisia annua]|uniref:protein-serine/threonine phosphatase n=1 Tax=Artemisia annua TaxID=35608 RepID=A0A2U1NDE4_ARTAN|nr:protein phosphatase 2C 29 [Artemisia annua]
MAAEVKRLFFGSLERSQSLCLEHSWKIAAAKKVDFTSGIKGFNFKDDRLLNKMWLHRSNVWDMIMFFRVLALCHTGIPVEDEQTSSHKLKYEAESPEEIRDTSVLVMLRPAWEDLRSYLMARGRKHFEVYVCTIAERDYALEMWRFLDPDSNLISVKELLTHVICMLNTKLDTAKSMTHDVIRDLLGVKLYMTNYAIFYIYKKESWLDRPQSVSVGSCCLVGGISNGTLFVENLRDSRVVLGRQVSGGKMTNSSIVVAERLSTDHNVGVEEVRNEVKALHPDDAHIVVYTHGVRRLKGIIQVSRSIGYVYLKKPEFNRNPLFQQYASPILLRRAIMSAEPSILTHKLRPEPVRNLCFRWAFVPAVLLEEAEKKAKKSNQDHKIRQLVVDSELRCSLQVNNGSYLRPTVFMLGRGVVLLVEAANMSDVRLNSGSNNDRNRDSKKHKDRGDAPYDSQGSDHWPEHLGKFLKRNVTPLEIEETLMVDIDWINLQSGLVLGYDDSEIESIKAENDSLLACHGTKGKAKGHFVGLKLTLINMQATVKNAIDMRSSELMNPKHLLPLACILISLRNHKRSGKKNERVQSIVHCECYLDVAAGRPKANLWARGLLVIILVLKIWDQRMMELKCSVSGEAELLSYMSKQLSCKPRCDICTICGTCGLQHPRLTLLGCLKRFIPAAGYRADELSNGCQRMVTFDCFSKELLCIADC